ncbi:hypothetical protein [Paenibacillus sp. PAMC21692]|uniref:hypothetical protein n=1 Tax=Paenibacillus sp. PAMC21692 TaxID=2762320 RepID=UPI00164D9485|nr:hypothetical protein [Paenibacillus sp. PAMC21692]QNK59122.1 hypothetical protein H7F31_09780 [Paenibacillus sp. PAMC21692]
MAKIERKEPLGQFIPGGFSTWALFPGMKLTAPPKDGDSRITLFIQDLYNSGMGRAVSEQADMTTDRHEYEISSTMARLEGQAIE